MNKKLSSLLLLAVLSVTDAYLLAHPNLIGRLGVLIYKHSYIKNFPSALLTVLAVVGISLILCEVLYHFFNTKKVAVFYIAMLVVSVAWFVYVYSTFSSFSYKITGKAFIYGAHLLPIILIGLFGRYFIKATLRVTHSEKASSNIPKEQKA